MDMKRFVGRDMRTALRMVREELGPDAMVLSNSATADGVEVVAAPPEMVAQLAKGPPGVLRDIGHEDARKIKLQASTTRKKSDEAPRQAAPASRQTGDIQSIAESLRDPPATIDSRSLASMQRELSSLRKLLEQQLACGNTEAAVFRSRGTDRALTNRLMGLGISERFASEIAAATAMLAKGEQAWREALAVLRERLPVSGDLVCEGGHFAVVGPTGAGKTTTLCKLAVRHVLSHDVASLAIVNLDHYRLGAGETLRALGRVLGVEIHEPKDALELDRVLDELSDRRLVLIDTAGLLEQGESREQQVEQLNVLARKARNLLVLPANAQSSSLERNTLAYRCCSPASLVITRLDETASLGEALEVAARHKLPIAYTSSGPEVPDDLEIATSGELLRRLEQLAQLDTTDVKQADEEPQVAELWSTGSYNDASTIAASAH